MIMTNDMYMNIEMWVKNKRELNKERETSFPHSQPLIYKLRPICCMQRTFVSRMSQHKI